MTAASVITFRKGHLVDLGEPPPRVRPTMLMMAACAAFNATGFGIVIPVFARRLDELGYDAADLALLIGSYAVAQFVCAPFLGKLADQIGRKPVLVLALVGHMLGDLIFLVASDLTTLVAARSMQGALEAGVMPAALASVADVVPQRQRGRWLGIILAAFGAAFVLGPVVGGALFDLAGFRAPFMASAGLALAGTFVVILFFRESLTASLRNRNRLNALVAAQSRSSFLQKLPGPSATLAILLLGAFTPSFVASYVEPQFMFFAYDVLGWSTTSVGLVLGSYGLSLILTQLALGRLSEKSAERRWVVAAGLTALSAFYLGMTVYGGFLLVVLFAAVSGLGKGILTPAINTFLLDLAEPRQRGTVLGLRTSASSLGAACGPAIAYVVTGRIEATTLFASAGVIVLLVALISALGLQVKPTTRLETESNTYELRSLEALRGLISRSAAARVD